MQHISVAIIGAGPYGLSLGAYMQASGRSYKVFGKPMHAWHKLMPDAMHLKSEGRSTNLHCPDKFTLGDYCRAQGYDYKDEGWPIPRDVFVNYGREFQQKFVKEVDHDMVISVKPKGKSYELSTASGNTYIADKVVLAVGIAPFAQIPEVLQRANRISHASVHSDLTPFAGKRVAVIGGGASATDMAVFLAEVGAKVELIARSNSIGFLKPPSTTGRTLLQELKDPASCMPGLKGYLYERIPGAFRLLPESKRSEIIRKFAGPLGGWTIKDKFEALVPTRLGSEVVEFWEDKSSIHLIVKSDSGLSSEEAYDHVVAATGYQIDLRRLKFLSPEIVSRIGSTRGAPMLSRSFETGLKNLFIVGPAASAIFGPSMRFACGAEYVCQKLVPRLLRGTRAYHPATEVAALRS